MIAALLAMFIAECGAQVWPDNAADGTPVETNRLVRSDWLAGADVEAAVDPRWHDHLG
jgi:hypothetical protein